VREKELGSRVRRAAPRRPRESGAQRTASSRGRLSREDLTPEEVRAGRWRAVALAPRLRRVGIRRATLN
jgi:hypothetical protein